MPRDDWKAAFEDAADSSHELMLALIESVKTQNYFAEVLNALDGGKRRTFDCPAAWIARLIECGTIPKR